MNSMNSLHKKKALILGITGQDGSYMAERLLKSDWEVHGMYRRVSVGNFKNIKDIEHKLILHKGDMLDPHCLEKLVQYGQYDVIYNFADQDRVDWSYQLPSHSLEITTASVINLLEYIRRWSINTYFLQPISATIFGATPPPQTETSSVQPLSPYACAKAATWNWCKYYRTSYGVKVGCPILYNHVSLRQQPEYLLHKIAKTAVEVSLDEKKTTKFFFTNKKQLMDVGYAEDFVEAMYGMSEQRRVTDYVVGTGSFCAIEELIGVALSQAGVYDGVSKYIEEEDFEYERPGPTQVLIANPAKIDKELGWVARRTAIDVIKEFVQHNQKQLTSTSEKV